MQKAIDEEIETVKRQPPDAREVQRAINQIEASFYRRMERVGGFYGKADQLNAYFAAGGGPDYFAEDLARYTTLIARPTSRRRRSNGCRPTAAWSWWWSRRRRSDDGLRLQAPGSRSWHGLAALVVVLVGSATAFTQERPDRSKPPALGPVATPDAAADPEAHARQRPGRCGWWRRTRCRWCRSTWW